MDGAFRAPTDLTENLERDQLRRSLKASGWDADRTEFCEVLWDYPFAEERVDALLLDRERRPLAAVVTVPWDADWELRDTAFVKGESVAKGLGAPFVLAFEFDRIRLGYPGLERTPEVLLDGMPTMELLESHARERRDWEAGQVGLLAATMPVVLHFLTRGFSYLAARYSAPLARMDTRWALFVVDEPAVLPPSSLLEAPTTRSVFVRERPLFDGGLIAFPMREESVEDFIRRKRESYAPTRWETGVVPTGYEVYLEADAVARLQLEPLKWVAKEFRTTSTLAERVRSSARRCWGNRAGDRFELPPLLERRLDRSTGVGDFQPLRPETLRATLEMLELDPMTRSEIDALLVGAYIDSYLHPFSATVATGLPSRFRNFENRCRSFPFHDMEVWRCLLEHLGAVAWLESERAENLVQVRLHPCHRTLVRVMRALLAQSMFDFIQRAENHPTVEAGPLLRAKFRNQFARELRALLEPPRLSVRGMADYLKVAEVAETQLAAALRRPPLWLSLEAEALTVGSNAMILSAPALTRRDLPPDALVTAGPRGPEADMTKKARRVFISYTHDSEQHRETVLALAQRLRDEGLDCHIDRFVNGGPPEGWPLWMERQVEGADFVLVVCTATYLRRYRGEEEPGCGQGGVWEAVLTRQYLYEGSGTNWKFVPILVGSSDVQHIPTVLRGATYYRLPSDYEGLYRYLTEQPAVAPNPVGVVRTLATEGGAAGDLSPKPLRETLRELLYRINPEVLTHIDSGLQSVAVMIATPHLHELNQLRTAPGFAGLLQLESTGAVMMASQGCSIGGHLNDLMDGEDARGYRLSPTPRLANRQDETPTETAEQMQARVLWEGIYEMLPDAGWKRDRK